MNLVAQSCKQANSVRLEDFSHFQDFPFQNKVEAKKRKDHSVLPKWHSSLAVSTRYHPFYKAYGSKPEQMPQKLCTWHRAKASTSRAVQHHTAAAAQGSLVQHHSPGKARGSSVLGTSAHSMAPSPKALQNPFLAGKSTQKTCWTSGTSHAPNTHPECPRFRNELLAPLKQLCLKVFSTACHHQQRFRFDLKLLHSLGRNLMMQNPALGLSACFSFLNYKCPFAQKHSLPA